MYRPLLALVLLKWTSFLLNKIVADYANFQTTIKEMNTFWKIAITDISEKIILFLDQANSPQILEKSNPH